MKKFLSLVLALAMTLSLVTISAGAKDFADSDELSGEQYEEAVNVMSEMGIIDGYASGDFQPQGTLTRGAAAKIIACMMLGKTTAEALGTQAAPFKDVPAGSTFAGYIAYCVESGLIDGYADGTFRPQNTLTGFAFLKMLLTALGYDSSIEGYTGTNWTVNVAGRATQIGLTDGNDEFVGTRAATREEACLYAVNALQATLVEYESKGTNVTVNGATVAIGASKPTFVTSSIAGAATSIDDTTTTHRSDYTVEFAEKYQPDLELDRDIDPFGRPSHTWSWKGAEIGTYVDYDKMVAEYTTEVTGKDLYDAIGRNILHDHGLSLHHQHRRRDREQSWTMPPYFTAGNLIRTNTSGVGETGNGVLTQVFVDTGAKEVYIAVINTYLAIADDDYDEKKDELDITVYGIAKDGDEYIKTLSAKEDKVGFTLDGEDFDIADYAEDDALLVNVAEGEVQIISDPELLNAVTITAFKKNSNVTVDGTKYDYADTAEYKHGDLDEYTGEDGNAVVNLKDTTYNVYLDQYGYAIGVEIVEAANQYLFLTGLDSSTSNLNSSTAKANVIFLDGSVQTVDINARKSVLSDETTRLTTLAGTVRGALANTWCTYTVDNDGVYTLTEVATSYSDFTKQDNGVGQGRNHEEDTSASTSLVTLDKSHITLNGFDATYRRVYANDDTVFLTAVTAEIEAKGNGNHDTVIIDDVDTVATGIQNVNLKAWDAAAVKADGNYKAAVGDISNGVYTLFDDDGYVIAAIVVGEDDGTTANYAFVTSTSMSREGYDKTADEYTWTREAIVNGELVTLTEVGDTDPEIEDMKQGNWYEVKYYADGTVRRVTELSTNPLTPGQHARL